MLEKASALFCLHFVPSFTERETFLFTKDYLTHFTCSSIQRVMVA